MKDIDFTKMYKAAEVKLTYITKVKASHRIPIKTAEDAACLFFMVWDWSTIEHIEEVKMIMLNRANRVLGVAHLTKGGLNGSIIDTRVILQGILSRYISSKASTIHLFFVLYQEVSTFLIPLQEPQIISWF
jgi:DNA repair protein RadC